MFARCLLDRANGVLSLSMQRVKQRMGSCCVKSELYSGLRLITFADRRRLGPGRVFESVRFTVCFFSAKLLKKA